MNRSHFPATVAAGIIAGTAGAIAMTVFSGVWTVIVRGKVAHREATLFGHGGRPDVESAKRRGLGSRETDSLATAQAAERIAESVMDRRLLPQERHYGGQAIHYLFGAAAGLGYAVISPRLPMIRAGNGNLFGLLLWAGAVLTALPALRLTAHPKSYSTSEHVFGLASHIVFGRVVEATQRAIARL